jgi:hypothetical protein
VTGVQRNAYPRHRAVVDAIDAGRGDAVDGGSSRPTAVTTAAAVISDVAISTTHDDLTTALDLRLDADSAQRTIGLRSAALPLTCR